MAWSGKRADFERLVDEHLPDALNFALRLTGDLDLAEELVQDSLLRATRAWKSFRFESTFRTWLFRIVINALRDRSTKWKPTVHLPPDLEDERLEEPSIAATERELGQLVARQVSRLPPRQREVLVLVSYEGMSTAGVAEVLEISEANVHANLHVARRQLRKKLSAYLAEN